MNRVAVYGPFEDLFSQEASQAVRFLEEASRVGAVHAIIWTDALYKTLTWRTPKYSLEERLYFLQALRWVDLCEVTNWEHTPMQIMLRGELRAVREKDYVPNPGPIVLRKTSPKVIPEDCLRTFPEVSPAPPNPDKPKKVLVTGTFDWLHTGHIHFFEEAAAYGELTVVVGHDTNIRLLKGEGHPMFPQEERLYMVQSIRYVHQAMLSTGSGWLDAEPELERLRPDIYMVNEDGDKPEKRAYCEAHGIEYLVLKRAPKEGLPSRSSTELRGF